MSDKKNVRKNKKNRGHDKRMPKELYEAELERLQVELVSMHQWIIATGARVVAIFKYVPDHAKAVVTD